MHRKLAPYLDLLEGEIKKHDFGHSPAELYEPIRYLMSLGGKRLRPLLTLLAYSLFKNDMEKAVKAALAVEVFHNFTLMHDDIMDDAPLRRGQATVHEKWNANVAILSGDVMLVKAYDLLLGNETSRLKEVIGKFNTCAAEVCEGQQLDMNFEKRRQVNVEEYLEMIRQKTSVLLGFSLELGAILADASAADCQLLKETGENIGMGFQLQDDLLDVYGNQEKFGKQVGGDIIANKKTFLLIKALEIAKGKEKEELENWISKNKFIAEEKVRAITEIYNYLGIKELTSNLMNNYFEKGLSHIEKLKTSSENKHILVDFFTELISREK